MPLVIGVGASAGGVEAFTQLLKGLPEKPGFAVVFVQHLAPQHESALAILLSDATRMPVWQVENGMPLEYDRVNVIPPNVQLRVFQGSLQLSARPTDHSQYTPIDYFFHSLAEEEKSRAIGVVLSGTARDGTQGLRDIKTAGGVAIVQDPDTAKFDGMPRNAVAAGVADLVLPPEQIGAELMRIAQHPDLQRPAGKEEEGEEPFEISEAQQQRLFALLRRESGVDFSPYKPPTIKRRLQRRMALVRLTTLDGYLDYLERNPPEVNRLFQDVLIQVTRFFRDPETYDVLAEQVFSELLASRTMEQPIRIWIPGCASGEEAYSVAITLAEVMYERAVRVPVHIFATDLSEPAIEHARAGCYSPGIADDVSPARLQRYFMKVDGHYRVNREIRDMCVFARQDVTRDPPFSRLDLIVCRNVLIYLGVAVQKKLMGVFHYALNANGFLLLGGAETIGSNSELFSVVDKKARLYRKKPLETSAHFHLPISQVRPILPSGSRGAQAPGEAPIQTEANRVLLERFAPPGVVIDQNLQILQFRGQTSAYLAPAPGEASLNLLKMAREGLLHALRAGIHEAEKSGIPARKEGLHVKLDERMVALSIEVIPLGNANEPQHYLVLFEETPPTDGKPDKIVVKKSDSSKRPADSKRQIARLEQELSANREYLQSIIEDLEMANEELQAANEEILSSNEELQSTNEELDTAKEELQSTNEELNTVNEELRGRNEELGRVNSDLLNLLASVQIAIVIISGDLRIRRFTPMAERVLNLIAGDIGRPISHFKPIFICPDLERLICGVLDHLTIQQRNVQDSQGKWYSLTIRPYRNVENRIDGAVLSLFDIDEVRRHEEELSLERDFSQAIVETLREPLLVLDDQLRVKIANRAFYQIFGAAPTETVNRFIYDLGNGQWDIPELRVVLEKIVPRDSRIENYRVQHDFPEIGPKTMLLNARRLDPSASRPAMILLAFEDITGRQP